jgi:hypothetical protein
MEFHLRLATAVEDINAVRGAVCALDPAAVIDTTEDGRVLRMSAGLDPGELAWALRHAGVTASAESLEIVPSVCCGGCSG